MRTTKFSLYIVLLPLEYCRVPNYSLEEYDLAMSQNVKVLLALRQWKIHLKSQANCVSADLVVE